MNTLFKNSNAVSISAFIIYLTVSLFSSLWLSSASAEEGNSTVANTQTLHKTININSWTEKLQARSQTPSTHTK